MDLAHSRRRLGLVLFLMWQILTLSAPLAANRGEYAHYEKALRDIRFKQWGEAVGSLRLAIADNPEEIAGPVTRPYGMHFEPYLPHFYLGLALCKLGQREEALEHWRQSDQQDVRRTLSDHDELNRKRRECELTFLPKALEEARRSRDQAREIVISLEANPPASDRDRDLTPRLRELRQDFDDTELGFESLSGDSTLSEALELSARFQRVVEDATALRQDIQEAQERVAEQQALRVESTLASFREEMIETRRAAEDLEAELERGETPLPRELEQRIHQVVGRVAEMERALSPRALEEAELDRLQSWRQQWTALRSSITNLAQRVDGSRLPPPLLEAAKALFAGDYQATLEHLRDQTFSRPRSQAQAALLRAAAHHALYLLSAQRDEAQLDRARLEVRRGYDTDPLLIPDPQLFSPRFRRFFGESLE